MTAFSPSFCVTSEIILASVSSSAEMTAKEKFKIAENVMDLIDN